MGKMWPFGMAPPQQPPIPGGTPPGPAPSPVPTMGNHMIPTAGPVPPDVTYGGQAQQLAGGLLGGPYQQQATQLAGLLGGQLPRQWPVMGMPYRPGRFMPGFRPGIDTPITRSGGFEGSLGNPVQRY